MSWKAFLVKRKPQYFIYLLREFYAHWYKFKNFLKIGLKSEIMQI